MSFHFRFDRGALVRPSVLLNVVTFAFCHVSVAGQPGNAPYLSQPAPGRAPELFAPGLVNTGMATRDITFSPDGNEAYFRVALEGFLHSAIVGVRRTATGWTAPEVPDFAADPRWKTLEPHISPDGQGFYFVSNRPEDPKAQAPAPMGIWVMERGPAGWGAPRRLGSDINGPDGTFFPSVTRDGTLYFCRDGADGRGSVWRARRRGGGFEAAERLPDRVQVGRARYNPFIAQDESFMVLAAMGLKDSVGGLDYYVLFRNAEDQWSLPLNLGSTINHAGNGEESASLSPDGTYFFFASARGGKESFVRGEKLTLRRLQDLDRRPGENGRMAIYWVEAGFLGELKKAAVFPVLP